MQFEWNSIATASTIINIVALTMTSFLFKKAFRKFQRGTITCQRLLRLLTLSFLLLMQVSYILLYYPRILTNYNPTIPKSICGALDFLQIASSILLNIALPSIPVFVLLTTLDRYKRLNMITFANTSFRKIVFLECTIFGIAILAGVFGLTSFPAKCLYTESSTIQILSFITSGFLQLLCTVIDVGLNIIMIKNALSNERLHSLRYPDTTFWQRFIKKIGYKNQLIGYFILLLLFTVSIIISAVLIAIILPEGDTRYLATFALISMGIPVHIWCTFQILDFLLVVLKGGPRIQGDVEYIASPALPSDYAHRELDANGLDDESRGVESDNSAFGMGLTHFPNVFSRKREN